MTSSFLAWFWSDRFWLPENVSWADLEHPPPGVEYPRVGDILYALPLAVGVFVLRILFERLVAKPCAHILQIQAGVHRQVQPNAVLERVYLSKTCPDAKKLEGLSKQLDWDVRKIQRWFRIRRNQDKPSMQTKFCESMWRFTFYLGIFIYAVRHLWVSPWTWDTRQCWDNYPFQHQSPQQFNHYVAELAFYWSLMFSQFTDIKRKDFFIMLVHHLATIVLITFSYANNMLRAGTLVMCVHDASDIFLEAAKLANYAKYQRLCDGLFVVFSISFFIARLVIFPFWIIHSVLIESWEIAGPYQAWWLFNGLLLVLQTLHIIWFYLIARIAIKAIFKGKVAKDDRSDIESSSDEEIYSSNSKHPNQTSGPTSNLNGEKHDH
ncbi:ceramide synthase 5-like [Phycodurus eques]|uniref:ceramide synthase 5-like n=1 Tax=Phycodurus eques TaxID=693459 RepID=UPI002ACEB4F7|nr:ceramide synthase 5-like [Phycodurus eques]XP_061534620.1 ceramide synthase 5-like [Phycodurus eques]XP_061534629.1 ceramide synthase 5-like [Phycodurus eques]